MDPGGQTRRRAASRGLFAIEEGIRNLIEDGWKKATLDDPAASYLGTVVVGASHFEIVSEEIHPDYMAFSGAPMGTNRQEEPGTPSVKTNLYVVILD